ncbi:hypothetical protein GCM10010309_10030 [Streptomyces violaceochromogenes]|nr:hypothetical protein GCM10010309_10030 [Streptomyces violaceochromogenes]
MPDLGPVLGPGAVPDLGPVLGPGAVPGPDAVPGPVPGPGKGPGPDAEPGPDAGLGPGVRAAFGGVVGARPVERAGPCPALGGVPVPEVPPPGAAGRPGFGPRTHDCGFDGGVASGVLMCGQPSFSARASAVLDHLMSTGLN